MMTQHTNLEALTKQPIDRRALLGLTASAALAIGVSPAFANITKSFDPKTFSGSETFDHTAWDEILGAYVKPEPSGLNRFDYKGAKDNALDAIKAYVKALEAADPTKLTRDEQFAYWANLYNAKTIEVVVEAYPVGSIREISINEGLFGFLKKSAGLAGPWKAKIITVKGEKLSLDDVEHEIMRKVFADPRVHYSVNCASIGCPNLRQKAFTGANLETELNAGARDFINTDRGISVGADGNVTASSIFNWFQVDFGGTHEAVIAHAVQYAKPEKAEQLKGKTSISRFEYDWSLNDVAA